MRQKISDFSDAEKTATRLAHRLDPDASAYNRVIVLSARVLVRDGRAAWHYETTGATHTTVWTHPNGGNAYLVTREMWRAEANG